MACPVEHLVLDSVFPSIRGLRCSCPRKSREERLLAGSMSPLQLFCAWVWVYDIFGYYPQSLILPQTLNPTLNPNLKLLLLFVHLILSAWCRIPLASKSLNSKHTDSNSSSSIGNSFGNSNGIGSSSGNNDSDSIGNCFGNSNSDSIGKCFGNSNSDSIGNCFGNSDSNSNGNRNSNKVFGDCKRLLVIVIVIVMAIGIIVIRFLGIAKDFRCQAPGQTGNLCCA